MVFLSDIPQPLVPKIPIIKDTSGQFAIPQQNILPQSVFSKSDYPTITKLIEEGSASNSVDTFYTVPANKLAWITAITMQADYRAASTATVKVTINGAANTIFRFDGSNSASDIGQHNTTVSFPIPIQLNAGETVELRASDATVNSNASIIGYVIDDFDVKSQVSAAELLLFRGFLNIFKKIV